MDKGMAKSRENTDETDRSNSPDELLVQKGHFVVSYKTSEADGSFMFALDEATPAHKFYVTLLAHAETVSGADTIIIIAVSRITG